MTAALLLGLLSVASHPTLGVAEGTCRPNEHGPSVEITVIGLKDRKGTMRAEIYPPDDDDFLADDAVLINAGKTFRRVEIAIPPQGPVKLCIRVPAPGTYSMMVLHNRDRNAKFSLTSDGVGFPGNPKIGHRQPPASEALITVGSGPIETNIVLNYWHGLFSFGPLKRGER